MIKYKPYAELECDNLDSISEKILALVEDKLYCTNGWIFLDSVTVLRHVPELVYFFKQYKLYPKHTAATILTSDLCLHMDSPPTVAKINFPILNTKGWVNRWYHIDEEVLASCPRILDEFGNEKEDIIKLPSSSLELCAELYDLKKPIVFNSRIGHSVIQLDKTKVPRVVVSFTFINEPLHLLQ